MSHFDYCKFELKILTTKSVIESINKYTDQLKNKINNLNTDTELNSNLIKELFKLKIKSNEEDVFNNPVKKVKPNTLIENMDNYYLKIDEQFKIRLMNNLTVNEDLCNLIMIIDDNTINNQIKENDNLVTDLRELMNKTIEFHSSPAKEEDSSIENKLISSASKDRLTIILPKSDLSSKSFEKQTSKRITRQKNVSTSSDVSNLAVVNNPFKSSTTNLSEARGSSLKDVSTKEIRLRKGDNREKNFNPLQESLASLAKKRKETLCKLATHESVKNQEVPSTSTKKSIENQEIPSTSTKKSITKRSTRIIQSKKGNEESQSDSGDESLIAEIIEEKLRANKKFVKFELTGAKEFLRKIDHERRSQNFSYLDTDWCLEIYSGPKKKYSERYLCVGLCCNKKDKTNWKISTDFIIGIENFKNKSMNIFHQFNDIVFEYNEPKEMISEDEFVCYDLLNELSGFVRDNKMIIYCELTGTY